MSKWEPMRLSQARECLAQAVVNLSTRPPRIEVAAVWGAMALMHLSHLPGIERTEDVLLRSRTTEPAVAKGEAAE